MGRGWTNDSMYTAKAVGCAGIILSYFSVVQVSLSHASKRKKKIIL